MALAGSAWIGDDPARHRRETPMPDRHVIFACELGNGLRQADRILPVAAGLVAAGHRVSVAMPDEAPAARLIAAAGHRVLIGPSWRAEPPPGFLAANFADVLLQTGYATPEALTSLLAGWLALFQAEAPTLVVADFAPTAMLACRVARLPVAAMGDGYGLPPTTAPLPCMRPWADVTAATLAETDGRMIAVINPTLRAMRAPLITRVADLFAAEATWLCTFPELDHYEGRGEADYMGEIPPPGAGIAVDWPAGTAERVLVMMDSRHRPFRPLLRALAHLRLPAVVQAWGMTPDLAAELSGPTTRVVTEPVNRDAMLADCDIVACQGSGVVAPALLAGRPVLMLPNPVEQMMTLYRVARQGLGHGLPQEADADAAAAALRRLLDDPPTRLRVANFARSYHGYSPSMATDAITRDCLDLLDG
jgi:UDP:flavonoid glycosyltransferase YjiC (YdhE family)